MSKLVNALERIWNWRKVNYNNPEDGLLHPGFTRKQIENMFQGLPFYFSEEVYEFFQYFKTDRKFIVFAPDIILHSLERALNLCREDYDRNLIENKNNKKSSYLSYSELYLFYGAGKYRFYVPGEQEKKESSPVWFADIGRKPRIYFPSLTDLMQAIAECFETNAFYVAYLDKNEKYLEDYENSYLDEDYEKAKAIFCKYNPSLMNWFY